jgi:very-short-patch-repair endonuclease
MTHPLRSIAKHLRKQGTDAERLLWNRLRARQIQGLRFRRQEPVGQYIVDFLSYEVRTVIEVDGGQHAGAKERDIERDKWLTNQGFNALRFWDNEVLTNIEGGLEVIRKTASCSPGWGCNNGPGDSSFGCKNAPRLGAGRIKTCPPFAGGQRMVT